ncbi:MAG: MlaD family protein [Deltaproteobacteria bacterium]|jgi:phospholipid/cholesterol/gamma-HCH transport system substrate-binding protein|nr:MlaD family protein [Deltaproteobacteria bacterium]
MNYTRSEKAAGLTLLAGFGFIAVAMVLVGAGRDWLSSYQNYFILLKSGYGLLPGVKVKFLRLDIGRVSELKITDDNMVKIDLAILTDFSSRLKGDSLASVNSPTIIGSEYIEIVPGDPQSPSIPPGGQIPAKDSQTVDQLLASIQIKEKLRQLDVIMKNVASITTQLEDPTGSFFGTMANLKRATGAIAGGEGTVGGLVIKAEVHDELLAALKELRGVSESLNRTALGLKKDLPNITAKIDSILRQVESGTRSFPEVARGAREGLREVDQILDSVKRNFLIRGNLSPDQPPESLTRPARER